MQVCGNEKKREIDKGREEERDTERKRGRGRTGVR